MIESKSPLFNDDAEEAVLSSIMMDETVLPSICAIVSAESFARNKNKAMFNAMRAIFDRSEAIDPLAVMDELKRQGTVETAGGRDYVGYLVDVVPTANNSTYYARAVNEAARRREAARLARELAEAASNPTIPVEDTVRLTFANLLPLAVTDEKSGYRRLDPLTTLQAVEDRGNNSLATIRTGFKCIDNIFHGFRPGELIIVGGAAKSGKTALTLNISRNVAKDDHGVGFQSCEMSRDGLTERLLNAEGKVHVTSTARGNMSREEWERVTQAANRLLKLPIEIDDTAMPDIDDVAAKVMALKARIPGLKMIVVDFLQLVTANLKDRSEAATLTHISYRLKALAKQADVVLFAPCQLNYKQIDKENREPELYDLQGSSGMAQAADAIFLCWRSGGSTGPFESAERFHLKCAASRRTEKFKADMEWNGKYMLVEETGVISPVKKTETHSPPPDDWWTGPGTISPDGDWIKG